MGCGCKCKCCGGSSNTTLVDVASKEAAINRHWPRFHPFFIFHYAILILYIGLLASVIIFTDWVGLSVSISVTVLCVLLYSFYPVLRSTLVCYKTHLVESSTTAGRISIINNAMLEQLNKPSADSLHTYSEVCGCKESCADREYTYDFVRDSASWSMSTSYNFLQPLVPHIVIIHQLAKNRTFN